MDVEFSLPDDRKQLESLIKQATEKLAHLPPDLPHEKRVEAEGTGSALLAILAKLESLNSEVQGLKAAKGESPPPKPAPKTAKANKRAKDKE